MDLEPSERMKAIDSKEQYILEMLGPAEMLDAVLKALSYDAKDDIFNYIIRCYDLDDPESRAE